MEKNFNTAEQIPLLFGQNFLEEHAGNLIQNPHLAIIELVANSLDAGADKIHIEWPENVDGVLQIIDNGVGMTDDEFTYRWMHFSYNRPQEQGQEIVFPSGNKTSKRKPFGRNGKGRHSMFCFSQNYEVETWKDGISVSYKVERLFEDKKKPYTIMKLVEVSKSGHGTIISSTIQDHHIPVTTVKELIWSKFIADPAVEIFVNSEKISLTDFSDNTVIEVVKTKWGDIPITFIEGDIPGRTSLQNGVAWWVNNRCVGDLSWKRMSESGSFIDRRTSEGKKFTFIVQADILDSDVRFDWTGFNTNSEKVRESLLAVEDHIEEWLRRLTAHTRRDQKVVAIEVNRESIEKLPMTSKDYLGEFIDKVQDKIPTIGQETLNNAVTVLCTLEEARSGRELLATLAKFNEQDMDVLYEILSNWNIRDAKVILDELQWRLNVISELEKLVEDPSTDELHQLQPLFESGLWIFGPEYESIEYTSNKTMSTVVDKFLDTITPGVVDKEMRRKRPDFIVRPDRSIGVYSRDGYDELTGEVDGIEKILIIELKRGGFEITRKEVRQAEDYAQALISSGKINADGKIIGYVLGTTVAPDARRSQQGDFQEITINSRTYSTVLRQAHARTFRLVEKIKEIHPDVSYEHEIDAVLSGPSQLEFPHGTSKDS